MTAREISDNYGITIPAAYRYVDRFGLPKRKGWTVSQVVRVKQMLSEGKTHKEIAKELNRTTKSVEKKIYETRRYEQWL